MIHSHLFTILNGNVVQQGLGGE